MVTTTFDDVPDFDFLHRLMIGIEILPGSFQARLLWAASGNTIVSIRGQLIE